MRVLSLFAGIGGLDLGLEWAGFQTVAFVERESACQHWLSTHWPGVPIHDDVRTFSGLPLRGLVDLVCGGFPCQPFSVAGKQKGTEDERHLWPEMSRIIREVRPRWVLAENVPGLRTIAADLVLEDLEGQGYTCWPLVVGVDDVGGPHRRKRVWILGYSASVGSVGLRHSNELPLSRVGFTRTGTSPFVWPSRPGEPQHAWEAPRLAHTHSTRRAKSGSGHPLDAGREPQPGRGALENPIGQPDRPEARGNEADRPHASGSTDRDSGSGDGDGMADSPSEPPRSPGQPRQEPDPRESESPMGQSVDGLPDGLAGLSSSHRREALKALGNAVCPWNAYVLGRAIMRIEEQTA